MLSLKKLMCSDLLSVLIASFVVADTGSFLSLADTLRSFFCFSRYSSKSIIPFTCFFDLFSLSYCYRIASTALPTFENLGNFFFDMSSGFDLSDTCELFEQRDCYLLIVLFVFFLSAEMLWLDIRTRPPRLLVLNPLPGSSLPLDRVFSEHLD